MTPTELRHAAERVKETYETTPKALGVNLIHTFTECAALALADHILSTVREDDGEPITEEWLRSLSHVQGKFPDDIIIGPVVRMIVRNAQSPSNGRWDWCVRSYPIPEEYKPQSRGQLRRLLEGLGVDSGK